MDLYERVLLLEEAERLFGEPITEEKLEEWHRTGELAERALAAMFTPEEMQAMKEATYAGH